MDSFDTDHDDEVDEESSEPHDPQLLVKHLRGVLKRQAAEAKALAPAKRELEFLKAGIDTTSRVGEMFFKSFEGDVEEARAEALELGILRPPLDGSGEPDRQPDPDSVP